MALRSFVIIFTYFVLIMIIADHNGCTHVSRYPRLITVDISGYGDGDESGTYGSMKACALPAQSNILHLSRFHFAISF